MLPFALAAAAPLLPPPARPDWYEAPAYEGRGCLREVPDPLAPRRVIATGDGAALIATNAGTVRVTVDGGVVDLFPATVAWAGIGRGGVPYALAGGRLAPYGARGGLRAELADVAPGLRVVAHDGVVDVLEEPRGRRLGSIAIEDARAVWALPDGRAVVDVPGETLVLWDGRAWSHIPRPDGELVRHGGQLRTTDPTHGVALDTSGVWRASGAVWGADVWWWTRQLGGDELGGGRRSVDLRAPHLDSAYPPPPAPPPPPQAPVARESVRQKLLQLPMIGTSGSAQGEDVVKDILGDHILGDEAWRIAPHDDLREWFPRLKLLNDGVREEPTLENRWTRPPHVVFAPHDAPVELLDLPVGCVATWAGGRAGLGILRCEDGSVYTRGATWKRELVAPGTGLITGDDGTILAVNGPTAWVRPPLEPGAVWARVEHPGVTTWRAGPDGTALALTLTATELAVDVYDASGHRGRRATPLLALGDPGRVGWLDVRVDPAGLAVVRWQAERGEAYTTVVHRFAP